MPDLGNKHSELYHTAMCSVFPPIHKNSSRRQLAGLILCVYYRCASVEIEYNADSPLSSVNPFLWLFQSVMMRPVCKPVFLRHACFQWSRSDEKSKLKEGRVTRKNQTLYIFQIKIPAMQKQPAKDWPHSPFLWPAAWTLELLSRARGNQVSLVDQKPRPSCL